MFSKSCEYALQAVIYIAMHQQERHVGISDIAESQAIPSHYLSKILNQLVKGGILLSLKGPGGGYRLLIPSEKLQLIKVVEQIDGLSVFDRCGIGLKICSDKNPCPIHFEYKEVKEKVKSLLKSQSLKDICEDIEAGKSTLIQYKK